MHKQTLRAIVLAGGLALPVASYAQAPPVGPGHCVANCGGGSGGSRGGIAPGGGGGGGGGTSSAIGAGLMGLGTIIQGASNATNVSTQSQIQDIRDRVQRRDTTRHKKKKTTTKGQPLG